MESLIRSDDQSVAHENETIKFRLAIAWALILIGVLLVLNANYLGLDSVRQGTAPNYFWNPDQARDAAWNVRFIGAMCFVAGFCERLLSEIRSLKGK